MASPPIPFSGDRADNPATPLTASTLMGWNQLVYMTGNLVLGIEDGPIRVTDYAIGVKEDGEVPDYITGRQDHTAWTKGPITSEGTLTYPFTFRRGLQMFIAGAELVKNPQESFAIQSTAHPRVDGCKINTVSISCDAGEMIESSATVWGIVGQVENDMPDVTLEPVSGLSDLTSISSADGDDSERTLFGGFGNPAGTIVANDISPLAGSAVLNLEQIPQWDVCKVEGAPPGMHVVGFSLEINNNLIRNYTMGDETGASPFGLNAVTITANQRRVSGTVRWQSNMTGTIAQILGVGLGQLIITVYTPTTPLILTMNNCLWNADPPRLSTNDRVTIESSFTALGTNETEFDALLITLPA
jgi:hypothetical protein